MKYYLEDVREVFKRTESSENGLSQSEAERRLEKYGKNKLAQAKQKSLVRRFFEQLADPMIIILIVAAVISAVTTVYEGKVSGSPSFPTDTVIILAVVLINAVLGVLQESKAEKAIEALQEMSAATSKVIREGRIMTVKSEDLTVGDVVVLEAGDAVPADCRIFESASLKIEEAALTGESVPVSKIISVLGAGDGGVVRELTRYDRVESIDLVEMDPQVIEACRAYLPGNACRMDDRRVHIYYENALKFIRKCEDEYDLIIVDSSDPFGPSEGLFTREFYGSCFNALRADGIMVNQQGSPFYAEDATAMQRSHQRIASTFPISKVYQAHIPTFAAGYWLFGFASKKYHPINDMDADAWNALNMRTRYYTSRLHVGAFYLPAFLEEMLREVEEH